MPRDYANHTRYQFVSRKSGRRTEWVILILLLLALLVFGIYFIKSHPGTTIFTNAMHKMFSHKTSIPGNKTTTTVTEKAPAEPEVQFDFYTRLQEARHATTSPLPTVVQPPPQSPLPVTHASEPHKLPPPKKPAVHYFLQLGQFTDSVSAGERRVSLLLSGIDADVASIHTGGKISYRVQQGPFPSTAAARLAQQRLKHKGIATIFISE